MFLHKSKESIWVFSYSDVTNIIKAKFKIQAMIGINFLKSLKSTICIRKVQFFKPFTTKIKGLLPLGDNKPFVGL